ncbi:hypothetical protein EGR_08527 [Echinococcus granulosus]|uniref:Uncharacterized protein n=1 Tax=Echinococcus granulosus TaxID=6210 RepID=W6U8B9_ECHGR|nr:hypothetical protein EGR_08527 [Echinococcus granulosus]EUB56616.1 hypothetical protein EGR_08527 [Echinococcus granulosus]
MQNSTLADLDHDHPASPNLADISATSTLLPRKEKYLLPAGTLSSPDLRVIAGSVSTTSMVTKMDTVDLFYPILMKIKTGTYRDEHLPGQCSWPPAIYHCQSKWLSSAATTSHCLEQHCYVQGKLSLT